MGYIVHDAIIVTAWNEKHLRPAIEKARELGLPTSEVAVSVMNGYVSFLIAPDGSKEGWADSNLGDAARNMWKVWAVDAQKLDIWFDWCHVRYGGDEPARNTQVVEFGVPKDE